MLGNTVINAFTRLFPINGRVSKDNEMSLLLMISLWVFNQHLPKTLLDSRSLVKFQNK